MPHSENNIRIAKNTILLYFRMLLILVVSLYTVRIVLNTLGVVDFGIYNVVGGVVVMFSFISSSMAAAAQRFFAFELGRNDNLRLKQTFSLTVTLFGAIAFTILVLAETIGLWFLNNKMVIPIERIDAANWIYQFSIFSFIITILTIPYNAVIISHENMKIYAYVGIIEVVLKLLIVFMLVWFPFDKLKSYAVLMFATTCIVSLIYRTICKRKYDECRYRFYWKADMFKSLLGYSGWNLFGIMSNVLNNQGINILLNLFFGPIVNASRAIAYRVNSTINQFVLNYITAARPQITKYYATGEIEQMTKLVFQSSKFSYFSLFFLSIPLLIETQFILTLWLNEVPDYVVLFTRLVIIATIIDTLSYPLTAAASATGLIKKYQMVVGGLMLLNLPISFCFLKLEFPPQITMYINIVISFICLFLRLIMLKKMIKFPVKEYLNTVLFRVVSVSAISLVIPIFLYFQFNYSLLRLLIVTTAAVLTSFWSIYFIGLATGERHFFYQVIKDKFIKKLRINYKK